MAGGVSRIRRLQARRDGGGGAAVKDLGLIWTESDGPELFADDLEEGEYVVTDCRVTEHRPGDVSRGVTRDRITRNAEDVGAVTAWDGRTVVGFAKRGGKRGRVVILHYTWPPDVPLSDPSLLAAGGGA